MSSLEIRIVLLPILMLSSSCALAFLMDSEGIDAGLDSGNDDDAIFYDETIEEEDADVESESFSDSSLGYCAEETEWVYVVDQYKRFLRFRPDSLEFEEVGTLDCLLTSEIFPFSMSVDRDGFAWVLYESGLIYSVDIESAECQTTSFQPNQSGFNVFGMGFVSDGLGSDEETLYIAGSDLDGVGNGSARLGNIDTQSLHVARVGSNYIYGDPELTGTGSGELWAFDPTNYPPSIYQIEKDTGEMLQRFEILELGGGSAMAWAFAFWGGNFFIFLQRDIDDSTIVWRFDPSTRSIVEVVRDSGYTIVGAGVSTCAPYELY